MVGFTQTQYRLEEEVEPHQLTIRVLSPAQSLVEDIQLTVTATDKTAISE